MTPNEARQRRRGWHVPDWWDALRPRIKVLVVVLALLAVAAAGYGGWRLAHPTCGDGTEVVDGECIGISDGSASLTTDGYRDLADVLGRIHQENERAASLPGQSVTVAYLLPVPRSGSPNSESERPARVHELQGALIAQIAANTPQAPVHVRMVVANDGDGSAHWTEVIPRLEAMVSSPDRLVSVIATGESLTTTQQAIGSLTAAGIPVVASRLTADDLDGPPRADRAFARIAPTNSDEAKAISAFLHATPSRALVVRSIDSTDTYVQTLAAAFEGSFPDATHSLLPTEETYQPGPYSFMSAVVGAVCQRRPDVIFFAGRSADLAQFVRALPQRSCPELPIKIVTGDDAVDLAAAVGKEAAQPTPAPGLIDGLKASTTVLYAGVADAEAWTRFPTAFAGRSFATLTEDCPTCFPALFPGSNLDDGAAIMGHDALATVIAAMTFGRQLDDTPKGVIGALEHLHGYPDSVPLASGWLSLQPDGEPTNKAVPIVGVGLDGRPGLIAFGSASGQPCSPGVNC